jgi:hypothetical protein
MSARRHVCSESHLVCSIDRTAREPRAAHAPRCRLAQMGDFDLVIDSAQSTCANDGAAVSYVLCEICKQTEIG